MRFYLLNYIICMYKYFACVFDNECFADKLIFFCCFPYSAHFYGELQCINIFLTPFIYSYQYN